MLQALRLHPMYKYQSQNGPSIRIIAELLRAEVMSPERDLASLADWQILNYLLGNWDGHTKNLSLLYRPGREAPVLAPFYDIVSIEYLNVALRAQFDRSMAFAVGELARSAPGYQSPPHKTPFPSPPHTHPLSSAIPPKLSVSPW